MNKPPRIKRRTIISSLEWGHFQGSAEAPLRKMSNPQMVRTLFRAKGHPSFHRQSLSSFMCSCPNVIYTSVIKWLIKSYFFRIRRLEGKECLSLTSYEQTSSASLGPDALRSGGFYRHLVATEEKHTLARSSRSTPKGQTRSWFFFSDLWVRFGKQFTPSTFVTFSFTSCWKEWCTFFKATI